MIRSTWWFLCATTFCALCLPATAAAEPAPRHKPFSVETTAWHLYGAYASPLDEDMSDDVAGVHVGWSYYFRDNLAIVPEVALSHVDQRDGPDAVAASFHLMLRAHVLARPRYSIYVDLGSGAWYGNEQVPPGGTRFNFPLLGGLGVTYRLDDRLHLMTGVRYWHVSNGFIEGRGRNPSHDGIQAYVGLLWEKR